MRYELIGQRKSEEITYKMKESNKRVKNAKKVFRSTKESFFHEFFCRHILQIFELSRNRALDSKQQFKNKFIKHLSKTSPSARFFLEKIRKNNQEEEITRLERIRSGISILLP